MQGPSFEPVTTEVAPPPVDSAAEPGFTSEAPTDPLASIPDATILRVVQEAYRVAKEARAERKRKNDRNWNAIHGDLACLREKRVGQSRASLPSLTQSVEQIAGQIADQLVSFSNWFVPEHRGDAMPFDLSDEQLRSLLMEALDDLYVEGNTLGPGGLRSLLYQAIKLGLIESEIVFKVSGMECERYEYRLADRPPDDEPSSYTTETPTYFATTGAPVQRVPVKDWRLRVELVPFPDFFPDPSSQNRFRIHEVDCHVGDLGSYGFDDEAVARVRTHATAADTEAQAAKTTRAGTENAIAPTKHVVRVREYWGDLHDPDTGECLASNVLLVTCGDVILQRPIHNPLWSQFDPFVRVALIPTPLAPVHTAFLDIAVPLVEMETELTNLVIDGAFNGIHGAKVVHDWKIEDPGKLSNGIHGGLTFESREGSAGPYIERVDTGTIPPETITILERIGSLRQEALAMSELALGRLPDRTVKATEIRSVENATDTLFSNIAVRFEDGAVEPLLMHAWFSLWQGLDDFGSAKLRSILGPKVADTLTAMTADERFVLMVNDVSFRVEGFKHQQAQVQEFQKQLTLMNAISANPALAAVWDQEFDPVKVFRILYKAVGIDPTEVQKDPGAGPSLDPGLLTGAAGNPQGNPALNPNLASLTETQLTPNPMGDRGPQL